MVEEPKIQDANKSQKTKEILDLLKAELSENHKNSFEKPVALLVAGSVPSYWDSNIMTEIANKTALFIFSLFSITPQRANAENTAIITATVGTTLP